MIKILIVDDSPTEVMLLKTLFNHEDDLEVIGCARNGKEAVALTASLKPNVITMDINMPDMDGLEATRLIMQRNPTPIVVLSGLVPHQLLDTTFKALEAGAVSVLEKPVNMGSLEFEHVRKHIVDTVRSMSTIKIIKRRFHTHKNSLPQKITTPPQLNLANKNYEIVALGTSIGGPQALKIILSTLPTDFPIPIVIVQHMTPGFITGFTDWLKTTTQLTIAIAKNQELLIPGTAYIAPDGYHLEVARSQGRLVAKLVQAPPIAGFCPSVTALLNSVAKVCGKNAIGVILTGMGNDGAQGLLALKQAQGHTIIQDQQSAVVFGMAGVAQSLGAVDNVVALDKIAAYLTAIARG